MSYKIINANILDWAREYDGEPFHAIICDPPYHLTSIVKRFGQKNSAPAKHGTDGVFQRASSGFMGQQWDGGELAFDPNTWRQIAQHLYPGGFGMAFASCRGWHRLAVAIEDAGLIIHPTIFLWTQGQGFPKATRIDNQVDRMMGEEQVTTGVNPNTRPAHRKGARGFDKDIGANKEKITLTNTEPSHSLAKAWEGHRYGLQALKPSTEPIIVFQRPYEGKPVENMLETGAGALNIDKGRIGTDNDLSGGTYGGIFSGTRDEDGNLCKAIGSGDKGRWPANFALSHSSECRIIGYRDSDSYTINRFTDGAKPWGEGAGHEYTGSEVGGGRVAVYECVEGCAVRGLDEQTGTLKSGDIKPHDNQGSTFQGSSAITGSHKGDKGGASRFFYQSDYTLEKLESSDPVRYQAKASKSEKDAGLDTKNTHPTVKPIKLNQWLASLLLPPEEYTPRRLLVPFSGVSSEMIGGILAGWDEVTGIELTSEYIPIAEARLKYWTGEHVSSSSQSLPIQPVPKEKPSPDQPVQRSLLDSS